MSSGSFENCKILVHLRTEIMKLLNDDFFLILYIIHLKKKLFHFYS